MADDIVDRLQAELARTAWTPIVTPTTVDAGLLRDARDEIGRLRAELDVERTANRITENHNHFDCAAELSRLRCENECMAGGNPPPVARPTCIHCGVSIFFDEADAMWRHDGHEGETCGETSPDTYAEPRDLSAS